MKRVVRLIVWPATSYSTYEPRMRHASRPRANKSESGWSAINAWRAKPIEGTVVICRTPSKISRLSRVSRTHIVLEVFSKRAVYRAAVRETRSLRVEEVAGHFRAFHVPQKWSFGFLLPFGPGFRIIERFTVAEDQLTDAWTLSFGQIWLSLGKKWMDFIYRYWSSIDCIVFDKKK